VAEEAADEHCTTTDPPEVVSTREITPDEVGECVDVDPVG
jgi:hypothetical protein